MHSASISTLALAFVIASASGLDSSRSVEVFSLAILVALVGVPHGALDHVVGQRLFRPAFRSFRGVAFFSVLLPLTVAALALVTAGSLIWSSTGAIETSLLRTVFLGLSAMAVPHLCLHVAAGAFSQRFTNPSAAHDEVFSHA